MNEKRRAKNIEDRGWLGGLTFIVDLDTAGTSVLVSHDLQFTMHYFPHVVDEMYGPRSFPRVEHHMLTLMLMLVCRLTAEGTLSW